jgi:hypothetical protein
MPTSKTRNKKNRPRPAATTPPPPPPLAPNTLAAESAGGRLGFDFRGRRFTLDLARVDFGRAMFAMKIAARGTDLTESFDRMLDTLEAILGMAQVQTLYEVAPDLFSSEDTQRAFWTAFTELTVGADLGELSAS